MGTDDHTSAKQTVESSASAARLFAVRLWKEELAGRSEYRGSVRDVTTDAFRGFRDWSDLVAFMVARLEEHESARDTRAGEVRDVRQ
ncbi:MAG TPA: hypothetical protein VNT23_06130 [Gaiellaceae bacterium]|nr:hypothetical protein [Gaiellaceae bacterium]